MLFVELIFFNYLIVKLQCSMVLLDLIVSIYVKTYCTWSLLLFVSKDLKSPCWFMLIHACINFFDSFIVTGKIFEIGSTGISSLGGHSERRTECINRFTAIYGRIPLVSTSVKVVDSRNIWFWWQVDFDFVCGSKNSTIFEKLSYRILVAELPEIESNTQFMHIGGEN